MIIILLADDTRITACCIKEELMHAETREPVVKRITNIAIRTSKATTK
jgi:hypothetical protein